MPKAVTVLELSRGQSRRQKFRSHKSIDFEESGTFTLENFWAMWLPKWHVQHFPTDNGLKIRYTFCWARTFCQAQRMHLLNLGHNFPAKKGWPPHSLNLLMPKSHGLWSGSWFPQHIYQYLNIYMYLNICFRLFKILDNGQSGLLQSFDVILLGMCRIPLCRIPDVTG